MRTRIPPKTFQTLTVDLLADHRPFADPLPPPATPDDWVYQGTITIDGVTGALAWRLHGRGIGLGHEVRELGTWEFSEIECAVGRIDPGRQHVPKFPEPQTWGGTWGREP